MRSRDRFISVMLAAAMGISMAGCNDRPKGPEESEAIRSSVTETSSATEETEHPKEDIIIADVTVVPEPREPQNPRAGDYEYVLEEGGTASIVRYYGSASDLTVPAELDGIRVRSIGEGAFSFCQTADTATLEDGIEEIGKNAFEGCSNLKTVSIPDSVSKIDYNPFINCTMLTDIKVSPKNGYLEVKDGVLFGKDDKRIIRYPESDKSESYKVPEGTEVIGKGAFSDCINLKTLELPEGIKEIGEEAFNRCSSLVKINIPGSVRTIGEYAFSYCKALPVIDLPEGLETIEAFAFHECISLMTIKIPGSVRYIKGNPFTTFGEGGVITQVQVSPDNPYLEYIGGVLYTKEDQRVVYCSPKEATDLVEIKDGTKTIGNYAFLECSSMKNIRIPDSVTVIEQGAFCDLRSLEELRIPKGVAEIPDFSFCECSSIRKIEIPEGIKRIGDQAFMSCAGLEEIVLPDSLEEIYNEAFLSCSALKTINLPPNLKAIGDRAFGYCTSLEKISLPDSVGKIGANPFLACEALADINISEAHPYLMYKEGALIVKPYMKLVSAPEAYSGASYVIPSGIRIIGEYAFSASETLKEVTIPEGVTSIGDCAFYYCTKLEELIIPEGVVTLGNGAINECESLRKVYVPKSVSEIGGGVFDWCGDLTVKAPSGSKAEEYCEARKIKYEKYN